MPLASATESAEAAERGPLRTSISVAQSVIGPASHCHGVSRKAVKLDGVIGQEPITR
jgi:hypothetical protein